MRQGKLPLGQQRDRQAETPDPTKYVTVPVTARAVVWEHDFRRRHRLVRIVALGMLASAVLLIPSALLPRFNPATLVALVIVFFGAGGAYLLSRRGSVTAAGYAAIATLVVAIAWEIVGKSLRQGGMDLSDLRLLDLFVLPIVLSAVLIDRRGTVVIAALSSAFSVVAPILLPKTPTLLQYWNAQYSVPGSAVDVISVAVVIQGLTAMAAWMGADSVHRALLEAFRADEVAAAGEQLAAQAQYIEMQRRRLQEGIARIQEVHAAVASGHWEMRARVDDPLLLPLATSLNLLLDRLSRLGHEQEHRMRLEMAAHQCAEMVRQVRSGRPYAPQYTGTAEDEVIVELTALLRELFPDGRANTAPGMPPVSGASQQTNYLSGSLPPAPPAPRSGPPEMNRFPEQGGEPNTEQLPPWWLGRQ